jgi:hypothetical protein
MTGTQPGVQRSSNRMKILHVYRDIWGAGGVPYEVRSLVSAQIALGHEVTAATMERAEPGPFYTTEIPSVVVSASRGASAQMTRIMDRIKPEVVHFYSLFVPEHNRWLRVAGKYAPLVLSPHGALNPHVFTQRFGGKRGSLFFNLAKRTYRRFVDQPLIKRVAAVHGLSDYECELARAAGVKHTFAAPNGCEATWRTTPSSALQRVKLKPTKFLFLGRLDAFQKGLDVVLDATRELNAEGYERQYEALLAGPPVGDLVNRLSREIQRGNWKNLRILPPVAGAAKQQLWNEASFFLHLSRWEGMARATREAISQGIPVLTTRESNMGDWVGGNHFGYQVDLHKDSVKTAMKQAMAIAPEIHRAMVLNCLKFSETYSWNKVAEMCIDGYRRSIGLKPPDNSQTLPGGSL